MDMVQRLARKMCALDGHPQNTQYEGKPMWASYAEEARTIIMTMRELTKAMEDAWGATRRADQTHSVTGTL